MATKKISKNCKQNTYKVNNGSFSSTRPSSSEVENYRLIAQNFVKVNNSNQNVKKITTISYAKDGTGTASVEYKNHSNQSITEPSDWNSYTDKFIIEKWTNGYLSGLLGDIIDTGTITISDTADYYNGNNSDIFNEDSLFFNGGFAYTVPRAPTGYSWVHNGAISDSKNAQKRGALSIWFKPSGIPSDHEIHNEGRMYLLSKRAAREWGDWALSFNFSDGLHFYQYTLGSGNSYINQYFGGNIQVDKWHHVVLSHNIAYNGSTSTINMYLNGQLLGTKNTVRIVDQPKSYTAIGTRVTSLNMSGFPFVQFNTGHAASDSRFYGYMKDYWFTDYTIPSSAQVATMYNNGYFKKPPFAGYNPYSAHWPLTANNGYIGGSTNRFTNRYIHPDGRTFPIGTGNLQSVAQIKYTDGVTPI